MLHVLEQLKIREPYFNTAEKALAILFQAEKLAHKTIEQEQKHEPHLHEAKDIIIDITATMDFIQQTKVMFLFPGLRFIGMKIKTEHL